MILETFDTCKIYMPYTVYYKLPIKTLFLHQRKSVFGTDDTAHKPPPAPIYHSHPVGFAETFIPHSPTPFAPLKNPFSVELSAMGGLQSSQWKHHQLPRLPVGVVTHAAQSGSENKPRSRWRWPFLICCLVMRCQRANAPQNM